MSQTQAAVLFGKAGVYAVHLTYFRNWEVKEVPSEKYRKMVSSMVLLLNLVSILEVTLVTILHSGVTFSLQYVMVCLNLKP